jgi:hypothetical protein
VKGNDNEKPRHYKQLWGNCVLLFEMSRVTMIYDQTIARIPDLMENGQFLVFQQPHLNIFFLCLDGIAEFSPVSSFCLFESESPFLFQRVQQAA